MACPAAGRAGERTETGAVERGGPAQLIDALADGIVLVGEDGRIMLAVMSSGPGAG
jgi:hypothetical protein